MSPAIFNQPDSGFHFSHGYPSTPGHVLRTHPEPWAAVSAAIGQFGAQSFMPPPVPTVAPPNPQYHPRPIITRPPPSSYPVGTAAPSFPATSGVPQGYSFIGALDSPPGYPLGSINPNDLSSGQPVQPRSVDVRIHGDVAKYISSLKRQSPPPREHAQPPKRHSVDIAGGDAPIKGFSTDYAGWREVPEDGTRRRDPSIIKWTTWAGEPLKSQGEDSATYICQRCGLHWLGALVFEDCSEDGKRKRKDSKMATSRPDQPLKFPDMLQYRWYLMPNNGTDPCLKGLTERGNLHPLWKLKENEQDCCFPARERPASGIQCFFDNCYFVDHGPAELRKHLVKRHWVFLGKLIQCIRDRGELDACDRLVAHRAMLACNGRDNAGKIKVSEPRRRVLSPKQISSTARYEEHAEWIEFLDRPKMEKWYDYHQENGQMFVKTYSMDPLGVRSEKAKLERYDAVTGEVYPARKKRRRTSRQVEYGG